MSVKKQILLIVILSTMLIAAIGSYGILSLRNHEQKTLELNQAFTEVKTMYELQHNFQLLGIEFDELYESQDIIKASSLVGELVVIEKDVDTARKNINCPNCKLILNKIDKELAELTPLLFNLKMSFANNRLQEARIYKSRVNGILTRCSLLLSKTTEMTAITAESVNQETRKTYLTYRSALMFASAIMVIFFSIISYFLMRGFVRSVKELNDATQDFSNGNRQRRVNAKLPYEFNQLAESFNQMASLIEASEETMTSMNTMLSKEVGQQRDQLKVAHAQTKQRMQEIAAYLGLAKSLTSSLSVDEILNKAVHTLTSALDVDYMVVGLISENSLSHCWEIEGCSKKSCPAYKSSNLECWTLNRTVCRNKVQGSFTDKIQECVNCSVFQNINIKIRATSGDSLSSAIGFEVPVFSSLCGQALLSLKPKESCDLSKETSFKSLRNMAPDCVSQISVPLITSNRVLGTIIFGYKKHRDFNAGDLELVNGLCQQIAIAVDNARLFTQTTKSAQDFSLLYKSGQALNSLLEERDIAHVLLKNALELTHAESGVVYLTRDRNNAFKKITSKKMDKETIGFLANPDGFISNVISNRESVLFDRRYTETSDELKDIDSAIIAPMLYNGEPYGAVAITAKNDGIFTYNDLDMLSTISGLAATAMHNAYLLKELEKLYLDTVKAFVQAIEAKDSYTRGHSENVARYATAIASQMGMPSDEIQSLEIAALLHDIGKIGIREDVLNKPGRLTPDEYEHIKLHPRISYQILEHVPSLKTLAKIILHHHERFDGAGYADGLSGDNIPLEARILAVADTFDAMTSHRPYRKPVDIQQARDELVKNSGTQFDPDIVRVFLEVIDSGELKVSSDSNKETAPDATPKQKKAGAHS